MSATQTEVFEAFRAIDVPEDKALRAAAALASAFTRSEDDTAKGLAKRDTAIDRLSAEVSALNTRISAEIAALDNRLTTEVAALNARIVKIEGDISLAMLVTLLFRSFAR